MTLNLQAPYLNGVYNVNFKLISNQLDHPDDEQSGPFKNLDLKMKIKVEQPGQDNVGNKRSFI